MAAGPYEMRKQPKQARSEFMVQTMKEAATRVLKDHGLINFTTNRVAEVAGISVGSLYQYFGSKEVLIAEIKRDHFGELRQLFQNAYLSHRDLGLPILVCNLIGASIKGHMIDPKLHQVLSGDLSAFGIKEDDDSNKSIRTMLENLLLEYRQTLRSDLDINQASRIVYRLVEETVHTAVVENSCSVNVTALEEELANAVLAYLGYRSENIAAG